MEFSSKLIYNLSQSIAHHKDTLRTIACNNKGLLVTGSFDKNCSFFQSNEDGNYEFLKDTNYHEDYIYTVIPDCLDRGFLSGSKDKRIIYMDNTGNPLGEFGADGDGHTATVNSLSSHKSCDNLFISGSWDTQARIWDINKQITLYVLPGHAYAVTVLALPNKKYVTGSQDKNLNFWDNDKKVLTIPNAHDDIIRSIILAPDENSIYTASNDMIIKQWTLQGQLLNTFQGHEAFIFSLCFNNQTHELFSSGDDRIVKIWKENGNYIQGLPHPNTVWDCTINPLNGDLLTACADGILRVFSNKQNRWMSKNALEEYENLCNLANVQNEEGNEGKNSEQVDINKLPLITEMNNLSNIKEGEIRLFNNFGKAEAYCFKNNSWQLLGEVMGQNPQPQKQYYPGDQVFKAGEYDYIFSVDLHDNMTQLPFNEGDNILVAAEKFVGREKLHKAYVDDVTKFLRANTGKNRNKKKVITQQKDYSKPKSYKNVNLKPQSTKNFSFPLVNYILYENFNVEGPKKKIIEINNNLNENDENNKKLTEFQIKQISKVIKIIGEKQFYHMSVFDEYELKEFLDLFTKWHNELLIPIFDLFRMYLLHPKSSLLFKKMGGGVEQLTILLEYLKKNINLNLSILSIRCICNLFNGEYSRNLLQAKIKDILDILNIYLNNENKNIRGGIIGILFNYSVIYSSIKDNKAVSQLISLIKEILTKENNEDNIIILLKTLSNLIVLNEDNRLIVKDSNIKNCINISNNEYINELKEFIEILLA